MERKQTIKTIIGTLIVVAILGSIGSAIYNGGWTQGFMIGMLASGAEGGELMAPHAMMHHGGSLFFGIIGAIFKIAFFFFFFMIMAKLFCFGAWRMMRRHAGAHGGADWSHFVSENPREHWKSRRKQYREWSREWWGAEGTDEDESPKKQAGLKNNGAHIDI